MSAASQLRAVGERAILVEVEDNLRALELAALIRSALGPAVEEVVPGHRTVLVRWPAGAPQPTAALAALLEQPSQGIAVERGTPIEIPVTYEGPDLEAVAARLDLAPAEVVALHSACTYRVAFVGFAPGFAYLLGGDPRLRVPRHAQPRPRVEGGSVALAGPYSAVYPRPSPGGWQVIGRTTKRVFDPDRKPPSLFAPGAGVRFVPEGER